MTDQIQQVLLSYWRRGTSGFLPVVFLLLTLITILQMTFLGAKIPASFIWIALYGPAMIAINLKQQVVQARERRLPRALGAHLGVGLALLLLVGVAIPMNRMFIEWHWCWGYPGLCLAITGLTLAGVSTQAQVLSVLFFAAPFAGQFQAVRSWIEALWRGELESSGVLLMGIGIGSIAFSIYWLLTATEEDRGYFLRFPNKQGDIYRRDAVDTEQSEALKDFWRRRGWLSPREPSGNKMAAWRNWANGTLWQQLKLWEFGRTGGAAVFFALVFPLLFTLLFILPQLFITRNFQLSSMMINPFCAFPVYFLLQMRLQQRAIWETELLRPVARTKFFHLAGAGIAGLVVALWLGFVAVSVAGAAIFSPEQLTGELVARFALLTANGQMWILAVGIWMARYRSMAILMLGFIASIMVIPIVGAAVGGSGRGNAIDIGVLAGCFATSCVLCACIVYDAYRRWLRVELG